MALKAITKPAKAAGLAKPAAAAKAPKAAAVAKPPKAAAAPKAKPEVKPFEDGTIVIFKGYGDEAAKASGSFTPGEELAVVGQSEKEGEIVVAVVKKADYHAFKADENSVNGEEILAAEVKRTAKTVEPVYHLPVVGEMQNYLKQEDGDPLKIAQKLFGDIGKAFFYLGGVLAKLYNEAGADGKPLFTEYQSPAKKHYEDSKEGFEAFLKDNFGEDMGGYRKAMNLIDIYKSFSALPNATEVVKSLGGVGWWKASLLARYVTDDNAKELVEAAKTQSYEKLNETLKTSYTTEGGSTPRGVAASRATIKKLTLGFKLYEDQGEAVEMILKAASKQLGTQDLNQVFEHIVTEWATDHLAEVKAKADAARERKTKALIKSGVKMPADHPSQAQAPAQAAA
ncbi:MULTISPECIES: hypothetical protein [unclassified Bradyrhizobium]|uniref:hypothetical protein n=1 Tax=unclassified Bradyrhizobium TaxID=2631580 RepID=UPI003395527C